MRPNSALILMALVLVLGLDGAPGAHAQTVDVLGFDAAKNGLKFPNTWASIPPWTIRLPVFGNIPVGNASNGLCGGMSYLVRDCFDADLLPPATVVNPEADSPLFTRIAARQTHSCDFDDAGQILWITKGDADLVKHMVEEEWPKVKSIIDSGEPCPLALTHGHAPLTDPDALVKALSGCHQVLAYGYTVQDNKLTLRIWDPNYPSSKTATIQMNLVIQGLTDDRALNWTAVSNYGAGRFRGFFPSHYSFKDPRKPTTASFLVQAVSSPGVGDLQPLPPVAIQRTWTQASGDPLIRFTGSVHDVTVPVTGFLADRGQPITQLMAAITTGGDDLRAGTGPNDNADIFLTVGDRLGNKTLTFSNINCNQHWNHGEVHKMILPLPAGAVSGDVVSLRLHTQFGGGIGANNWDVNALTVTGFLPLSAGKVAAPVTRTWLKAEGNPLVQFTGDTHVWSHAIACPQTDSSKPICALNLTVTTGSGELHAGTGTDDHADVTLALTNGKKLTFENINQSQHWAKESVHTVTLLIASGLTGDKIASFELHAQLGGDPADDRWSVDGLDLHATLDNSGLPSRGAAPPQPPRGR